MTEHYIFGFDPGKTTGVAVLCYEEGTNRREYRLSGRYVILWEDRSSIKDILSAYNKAGVIDAIVVEGFTLYEQKAPLLVNNPDALKPCYVIERINVYCEELRLTHLIVEQFASRLYKSKGLKWPIPSDHYRMMPSKHTRDAYTHARLWLLGQTKGQR